MKLRLVILFVIVVLLFAGVFVVQAMLGKGMNDFFDNMPTPAQAVTVAEARTMEWDNQLSAVGTARAVQGTQLTTQAAGLVTAIRFQSGDQVKAGQVLLTLDSETDRSELTALRSAVNLTRTELERLQRLYEQGTVARAELDRARSEWEQARGRLESQQARVGQKDIRAPFDGLLGIRQVNVGEYLSPGTPVVSIQQMDPIYIDFSVPEQYLPALHLNQGIQVQLDAWKDQRFEGRITAMEPGIDVATRNLKAQATISNPDGHIRSGMFARVLIDLGTRDTVVAVPQTAISYNPYGNAVFVVVEGQDAQGQAQLTVKRRFVRTGRTQGDFVAILEGLEPGERVATSGLLRLNNDTVVTISDAIDQDPQLHPTPANS